MLNLFVQDGFSAYIMAAQYGHAEVMQVLLEHGALSNDAHEVTLRQMQQDLEAIEGCCKMLHLGFELSREGYSFLGEGSNAGV